MAHWVKKFLSCGKRVEVLQNIQLKDHLKVTFSISNISSCTVRSVHSSSRNEMWQRLKKNDPEMDIFLSNKDTINRIKDITKVMECSVEQATELVKRDSLLGVSNSNKLYKKIELLMSYKFSAQDIISNPSVLHRAYEVLQQRLSTLTTLKCQPNKSSLAILKKSDISFETYLRMRFEEDQLLSLFPSSEHCIAALLDCSISEVKLLIADYSLMSVSLILLKKKIDVFHRFQIPNDIIKKNIRVLLNVSCLTLETRLQLLKDRLDLDIPFVKLGYMLSCKWEDFERCITTLKNKCEALEGCKDKTEYLVFRLKCSKSVAKKLANSKPIATMSEVKLQKVLDFFLDEMKVGSDFIISNTYLAGFSLDRMQHRWAFISSSIYADYRWMPQLFTMSDKSFQKMMEL